MRKRKYLIWASRTNYIFSFRMPSSTTRARGYLVKSILYFISTTFIDGIIFPFCFDGSRVISNECVRPIIDGECGGWWWWNGDDGDRVTVHWYRNVMPIREWTNVLCAAHYVAIIKRILTAGNDDSVEAHVYIVRPRSPSIPFWNDGQDSVHTHTLHLCTIFNTQATLSAVKWMRSVCSCVPQGNICIFH